MLATKVNKIQSSIPLLPEIEFYPICETKVVFPPLFSSWFPVSCNPSPTRFEYLASLNYNYDSFGFCCMKMPLYNLDIYSIAVIDF